MIDDRPRRWLNFKPRRPNNYIPHANLTLNINIDTMHLDEIKRILIDAKVHFELNNNVLNLEIHNPELHHLSLIKHLLTLQSKICIPLLTYD